MFEPRFRKHSAKCPHCGEPHHYAEVKFPAVNDRGSWLIRCSDCDRAFAVDLGNPRESDRGDCKVIEILEDETYGGPTPYASEVAVYSLQINEERVRFDFGDDPIYVCETSGENLEAKAIDALVAHYEIIAAQLAAARNCGLAGRLPDFENAGLD